MNIASNFKFSPSFSAICSKLIINKTNEFTKLTKFVNYISVQSYTNQRCKTFFITTPVFYVNAEPHIGHLYSSVIADTISRWKNLQDSHTKFSTGIDEHGSKIQRAAAFLSKTPLEYCDSICYSYKKLVREFQLNCTDFVRTTDDIHQKTVEIFWNVLEKNGYIYSSDYEGWYCVSDETFLLDSELKESMNVNGQRLLVSRESGHTVEWIKERNYLFKLKHFQDDLLYWLKSRDDIVRPKKFYKILLNSISEKPLPDISISRPISRVNWGIPVPTDYSQTIYVWLDALVNYLTAARFHNDKEYFRKVWPPDVQVIGKDILKFHGIYWPAFLMAAKLEPPRHIFCHSHWLVNSVKMSKSKKNVVDPFSRADIYTADGLRYFLLRIGVPHNDGNYNDDKVVRVLNSELADTLGNLLNRCTSSLLNPEQKFPRVESVDLQEVLDNEVSTNLVEKLLVLPEICEREYNNCNFYKVIDSIIVTLHSTNLFFESMKPWELIKNHRDQRKLDVVLHITMEALRITGILLQPIVPNLAKTLLDSLCIKKNCRSFRDTKRLSWKHPEFLTGKIASNKLVLYKRLVPECKKKIQ